MATPAVRIQDSEFRIQNDDLGTLPFPVPDPLRNASSSEVCTPLSADSPAMLNSES
jgi:hypothetical protein